MEERYVIKPTSISNEYFVSSYDEKNIRLDILSKAKIFTNTQDALDYMDGFPYLVREDETYMYSFTLETIYFIEEK